MVVFNQGNPPTEPFIADISKEKKIIFSNLISQKTLT